MRYLNKMIGAVVCTLGMTCVATVTQAAPILSFNNAQTDIAQTYQVGDTISLGVWLSGLEDVDLGGFDLNLVFNNAVSQFQNATFSADLDDSLFGDLAIVRPDANSLNLSGVSYDWDLSDQANEVQLFSLEFIAGSVGTSVLSFGSSLFSDGLGLELLTDNFMATLTVEGTPTPVDEPGTLAMLACGLALLTVRRFRPAA